MWPPSQGAQTPSTASRTQAMGQVPPDIILHACAFGGSKAALTLSAPGSLCLGAGERAADARILRAQREPAGVQGVCVMLAFGRLQRPATMQPRSCTRKQCGSAGACSATVRVQSVVPNAGMQGCVLLVSLTMQAHTSRGSLRTKGCSQRMQAGALVTAWLREMSAYVKQLDPAHMVSSGGVGYRLSAPSMHRAAGAAAADARLESMERRTLVADAAAEQAFIAAACYAEGVARLGAD